MTNNNRVGSNVDLFCKLYYNFDQNGPGQGWFNPVLTFKEFRWITVTQKDMTGGCYSLTLITTVYG